MIRGLMDDNPCHATMWQAGGQERPGVCSRESMVNECVFYFHTLSSRKRSRMTSSVCNSGQSASHDTRHLQLSKSNEETAVNNPKKAKH